MADKTTDSREVGYERNRAMQSNYLRLYSEPEEHPAAVEEQETPVVKVTLGEILPLLADAVSSKRTWLRDFVNDDVSISSDLHEVILAYQHFQRPTA